jgi:hypothetical protein
MVLDVREAARSVGRRAGELGGRVAVANRWVEEHPPPG